MNFVERIKSLRRRERIHIYIIPTWYCFLYSAFLVTYAGYGVTTRNVVPIAGGVFLFLIVLLAMVETNMNVRDFSIVSVQCPPTPEDQEGIAYAEITGSANVWAIGLAAQLKKEKWRPPVTVSFDPKKSTHATVPVPLPKRPRGVHEVLPIRAASRFPLSLFHAWKYFAFKQTQVIYPAPVGTPLKSFLDAKMDINGQGESISPKGEQDYKQHREFVKNDNPRRIDWRATTRRGKVIIKDFAGQNNGQYLTLRWLDTTQTNPDEKLRQLSLWVQEASALDIPYALETPFASIPYGQGPDHWVRCVTHLADFDIQKIMGGGQK